MAARGVEVFLGTLERPDDRLLGEVAGTTPRSPATSRGSACSGRARARSPRCTACTPDLRIYQTEQECGDGRNDWRHARYAWPLMKQFLRNGANAYMYWNISLLEGGLSRWGWTQNSLVVVDPETAHLPLHARVPAAQARQRLRGCRVRVRSKCLTYSGYDNQLAFLNPDGSIVLVIQNDMSEDMPVRIMLGDRVIAPTLPADSFSTFVLPPTG